MALLGRALVLLGPLQRTRTLLAPLLEFLHLLRVLALLVNERIVPSDHVRQLVQNRRHLLRLPPPDARDRRERALQPLLCPRVFGRTNLGLALGHVAVGGGKC